MRYQDPQIETKGTRRKYYEIRPYVPIVKDGKIIRDRKRIRLGWCDEITLRQAKAEKQQIMATLNCGRGVVQAQIPMRELIRKFRDARIPQLASSTQEKYLSHIANHIEPCLGELRLVDIDRPTIETWLNHKETLSWATKLDLRNIVSALFTAAIEWRLWDGVNPAQGARVGQRSDVRPRKILEAADLGRFLSALPDTVYCPAQGVRLMVLLAVGAGLRVSEVMGLKWEDIDWGRGLLTVSRRWRRGDLSGGKTAASRRIRQIGPLIEELRLWQKRSKFQEYLFGDPNKYMPDDRDLQQHVFRPTAKELGIYFPGFGMHSFRRMSITWRQECGATPIEAMRGAGHTKIDMTMLYTVTDAEREREQVQKMMERIGGNVVAGIQ
ncbi:MAG: tyrosine-type recombinase/integrase [Paludibaculum sp.]